ncbi:unnamed protein product, partial [Prorocentrum cordatum]
EFQSCVQSSFQHTVDKLHRHVKPKTGIETGLRDDQGSSTNLQTIISRKGVLWQKKWASKIPYNGCTLSCEKPHNELGTILGHLLQAN